MPGLIYLCDTQSKDAAQKLSVNPLLWGFCRERKFQKCSLAPRLLNIYSI